MNVSIKITSVLCSIASLMSLDSGIAIVYAGKNGNVFIDGNTSFVGHLLKYRTWL